MRSSTGLTTWNTVSFFAARIPVGIPTNKATVADDNTRAMVSMESFHRPILSINKKPIAVPNVSFRSLREII